MNSNGTQPQSLKDWITVLHNASQVPQGSQRYDEAQQVAQDAMAQISHLNQTASEADVKEAGQLLPGVAGSIAAGAVGFGRGASLGLVKPPSVPGVGDVISQAHPTATTVGDIAGGTTLAGVASPLVAGMSPVLGGAVLAGGYGAARGAIDPQLTGDRLVDSAIGGLGGAVLGAVGGKVSQKIIAPILGNIGRVGNNLMRVFAARGVPQEAAEQQTEQLLRGWFAKQGITDAETVDRAVARWRTSSLKYKPKVPALAAGHEPAPRPDLQMETPSYQRTAARLGTKPPPVPTATPEGVGNPPPNPALAQQYVKEANARIEAAARPDANPQINPGARIREMEASIGRKLTDEERERVLTRLLGPLAPGGRPGHPYWRGPGTFTP